MHERRRNDAREGKKIRKKPASTLRRRGAKIKTFAQVFSRERF